MPADRLTDEQVAEKATLLSLMPHAAETAALAREVQEYRALRPDCPTCGGSGSVRGLNHSSPAEPLYPCFYCTDGKMPLDKWVALLVETLVGCHEYLDPGNDDGPYPDVDAVLKMVPK